ncbi:hypothetical protein MRX96_010397 [Rhipicephalus microplus]
MSALVVERRDISRAGVGLFSSSFGGGAPQQTPRSVPRIAAPASKVIRAWPFCSRAPWRMHKGLGGEGAHGCGERRFSRNPISVRHQATAAADATSVGARKRRISSELGWEGVSKGDVGLT